MGLGKIALGTSPLHSSLNHKHKKIAKKKTKKEKAAVSACDKFSVYSGN